MSWSPRLLPGTLRVEQVQLDAPDLDAPDLGVHVPARILDLNRQRRAVGLRLERDGQVVEVVVDEQLLLPAVVVEALAQVALLVEQADADERQAEVAGGLEVVAGQDAQAARVDRQALGQAVLGGEVGDDGPVQRPVGPLEPAGAIGDVGVDLGDDAIVVGEEAGLVQDLVEPILLDHAEHEHGVVVGGAPEVVVEATPQVLNVDVPGPDEVVGEVTQTLESGRERWRDGEGADGTNLFGQVEHSLKAGMRSQARTAALPHKHSTRKGGDSLSRVTRLSVGQYRTWMHGIAQQDLVLCIDVGREPGLLSIRTAPGAVRGEPVHRALLCGRLDGGTVRGRTPSGAARTLRFQGLSPCSPRLCGHNSI